MASSLTDLLVTMQQGVQGINNLATQIKNTFPQATTSSTVVPSSVGGVSFTSSEPVAFLLVTLSSGVTVKIPYYNQ